MLIHQGPFSFTPHLRASEKWENKRAICVFRKLQHVAIVRYPIKNNHFREVTKMVYISLATVTNSATVPSILQRSAKWQYLYFDRGIKAFLGCSDWIKVFYRKEGLS